MLEFEPLKGSQLSLIVTYPPLALFLPFQEAVSFLPHLLHLGLLAPGQQIRTTRLGGGYALASGTSIAAPHVAGAWAAIREAPPDRSVSEILFALQSTGEPLIDSRNELTFPRLDVALALEALGYAEDPDASSDGTENPPNPEPRPTPTPQDRCGLIGLEVLIAAWVVRFRRKGSSHLIGHRVLRL